MDQLLLDYLVTSNYLEIDHHDIKLQLLAHPEYPSLKSFTDTLDYFEIENIAATIPTEYLDKLPENFLTLFETDEGKKLVLISQKISDKKIKIIDEEKNKKSILKEDFLKKWDPTIIAIEPKLKGKKSRTNKIPDFLPLALIITFAVVIFGITNFDINAMAYYLVSLIGGYLSYLIAKEELGFNTPSVVKFCTKYANTSCTDVINDKGSKIFNLIALSDMAVAYSLTTLLFLIFRGFDNSLFFTLGAAALPVLLYSVFYQWRVLKKWCLLCLSIASISIIQFLITALNNVSFAFPVNEFLYFTFTFALTFYSWSIIKSKIKASRDLESTQIEFTKFKRNYKLFTSALGSQSVVKKGEIDQPEHTMSFGNSKALLKIIAVTNPLCGFCKASFELYSKLLTTHNDRIQITFVFNVHPDTEKNKAAQIAHRLLETYYNEGKDIALTAFKTWFRDRDINSWQKEHGISSKKDFEKKLELQSKWCSSNGINYTPATILNERIYPKEYEINDLVFFVDNLIADKEQTSQNTLKENQLT